MELFWSIASRVLGAVGMIGLVVWILAGWWKKSDDRPGLLVRWLFTLADLLFLGFVVGPLVARFDYAAAFVGIPMAAVAGVILATIWGSSLTEYFGRKFGQLYDGGDVPATPEPVLSIAEARRKVGKYDEAVAEVRRQLEIFPHDFRLWMSLAEIQAQDLHDLTEAANIVERLINQPDHAPKNIAFALTRLADWHLEFSQDSRAAMDALERIVQLYPDSPEAYRAQQRLARLIAAEPEGSPRGPTILELPPAEPRIGIRPPPVTATPPPDPVADAERLVAQLERCPYDNETREQLAVLYATGFHRLDLATEQIEQLLAQANAPQAHLARWYHLLADLQIKEGGDVPGAAQTLQRLIDSAPESALAETARRRLATLALETRAAKDTRVVPLAAADPRLGLRSKT